MKVNWDLIIAMEALVFGLVVMLFAYHACSAGIDRAYTSIDLGCFMQYAAVAAAACIASALLSGMAMKKAGKNEKKKQKEQIHIPWPKENN